MEYEAKNNAYQFDIRETAKSYSSIAGALAGFSVTIVVLLLTWTDTPKVAVNQRILLYAPIIGFITAFFGCILSSFIFAVISGQGRNAPRAHTMALLGGSGFAISAILVLWAMVNLVVSSFPGVFLIELMKWLLLPILAIGPIYLISSALDPIQMFEERSPTSKEYKTLIVLGLLPLPVFLLLLWFISGTLSQTSLLIGTFFLSVIVFFISTCGALIVFKMPSEYRLPLWMSGIWIGICSLILGALFAFSFYKFE